MGVLLEEVTKNKLTGVYVVGLWMYDVCGSRRNMYLTPQRQKMLEDEVGLDLTQWKWYQYRHTASIPLPSLTTTRNPYEVLEIAKHTFEKPFVKRLQQFISRF